MKIHFSQELQLLFIQLDFPHQESQFFHFIKKMNLFMLLRNNATSNKRLRPPRLTLLTSQTLISLTLSKSLINQDTDKLMSINFKLVLTPLVFIQPSMNVNLLSQDTILPEIED